MKVTKAKIGSFLLEVVFALLGIILAYLVGLVIMLASGPLLRTAYH